MKRSLTSYVLIILLLFQTFSAIPAGWVLIIDPTGSKLFWTTEVLKYSPFSDFLIPGLFLLIVLGLFPILVVYGLMTKKEFKLLNALRIDNNYHWSWNFSYYLGLILVLWINMQLYFGIEFEWLHFAYSFLGLLMVILTHLPATKRYYLLRSN